MMQLDDLLAYMEADAKTACGNGSALHVDAWRAMEKIPHTALFFPRQSGALILHRDDRHIPRDLQPDHDDALV